MVERLETIELPNGKRIELFSVYDQYCFKHEGNFLKTYCPSCFRDEILGLTTVTDGRKRGE